MQKVRFISTIPNLTVILKSATNLIDHSKGLNEYVPAVIMKFKLGTATVKDESVLPEMAKGLSTIAGGAAVIKSTYETFSPEIVKLALEKIRENKLHGRAINYKIHPEDERIAWEMTKHPDVEPKFEEGEVIEHTVTKEDLEMNPELKDEVKEGDTIGLPKEDVELNDLTSAELDTILKDNSIAGRSSAKKREDKIKLIEAHFAK